MFLHVITSVSIKHYILASPLTWIVSTLSYFLFLKLFLYNFSYSAIFSLLQISLINIFVFSLHYLSSLLSSSIIYQSIYLSICSYLCLTLSLSVHRISFGLMHNSPVLSEKKTEHRTQVCEDSGSSKAMWGNLIHSFVHSIKEYQAIYQVLDI